MEKCDQYIPKTRPVLLLLTKAKTIKLNKNKIELLDEKRTLWMLKLHLHVKVAETSLSTTIDKKWKKHKIT